MNKLLFAFALILGITSCQTLNPCENEDFIGSYSGPQSCDTDAEDTTYEIFKDNNEYFIRESGGTSVEIVIDGCDFDIPTQGFLLATISGDGELNGDKLFLQTVVTSLGQVTTCDFEGEK